MPPKRLQETRPKRAQGRYFVKKGPTSHHSSSSEDDQAEDGSNIEPPVSTTPAKPYQIVKVDLQNVEIVKGRIGGATAIAEAQRKALESNSEDESESDNESESSIDRKVAVQAAKIRAATQVQSSTHMSDIESSSGYDTESEDNDEEEDKGRILFKPVFIPKHQRDTVTSREEIEQAEKEAEEKSIQDMERRKKESRHLVGETIRREMAEKEAEENNDLDIDDTDGVDPETEYEEWKLRELARIKRDREERIAREKELDEIERRRNMPEEERLKEDLKRAKQSRKEKSKGEQKFLQKYYHKGVFFADEDILKRDYTAPTEDEVKHRELLPEIMQVRDFGKRSRSKWTHLANEDTTRKDAGWYEGLLIKKRRYAKTGTNRHEDEHQPREKRKRNE